jgi:UDP-N-acetylmuramate dehydrogenase
MSLRKALLEADIRGTTLFNEPMSKYTSFAVGGPAEALVAPSDISDLRRVLSVGQEAHADFFVLGAGANILVSDAGIPGVVIDMSGFDYCVLRDEVLTAGAGTSMSEVCEYAARHGLSGLEFIYSMPGSAGGSVWMNARCYEESMADKLISAEIVDIATGDIEVLSADPEEFSYKRSPFQKMNAIILEVSFDMKKGDPSHIRKTMKEHQADRTRKGHFKAPSVGSIFKNNR